MKNLYTLLQVLPLYTWHFIQGWAEGLKYLSLNRYVVWDFTQTYFGSDDPFENIVEIRDNYGKETEEVAKKYKRLSANPSVDE